MHYKSVIILQRNVSVFGFFELNLPKKFKDMNHKIKAIIAILLAFVSFQMFADRESSSMKEEKQRYLKISQTSNPNRPRCPGRHLTCMYAGDHVTIDLPESISFAEIDIKDNETSVVTGVITYSDPTMYFDPLSGSYDIFVITHSLDGIEQQYTATLNF
jgi:hypothetical protein